jgi:hypothetical protein
LISLTYRSTALGTFSRWNLLDIRGQHSFTTMQQGILQIGSRSKPWKPLRGESHVPAVLARLGGVRVRDQRFPRRAQPQLHQQSSQTTIRLTSLPHALQREKLLTIMTSRWGRRSMKDFTAGYGSPDGTNGILAPPTWSPPRRYPQSKTIPQKRQQSSSATLPLLAQIKTSD